MLGHVSRSLLALPALPWYTHWSSLSKSPASFGSHSCLHLMDSVSVHHCKMKPHNAPRPPPLPQNNEVGVRAWGQWCVGELLSPTPSSGPGSFCIPPSSPLQSAEPSFGNSAASRVYPPPWDGGGAWGRDWVSSKV